MYFSVIQILREINFLGELPPYFMARAHRLSGYDPDEDENEFEELQEKLANNEEMVRYFLKIKIREIDFTYFFLSFSELV